jgi:transposase
MGRTLTPYPAEFRAQMVELFKAGRTPQELAREFEPTAQTILNWAAQADRGADVRHDGLTSAERQELTRLRRKVRQLETERDILSHGGKEGASPASAQRSPSRTMFLTSTRTTGTPMRMPIQELLLATEPGLAGHEAGAHFHVAVRVVVDVSLSTMSRPSSPSSLLITAATRHHLSRSTPGGTKDEPP